MIFTGYPMFEPLPLFPICLVILGEHISCYNGPASIGTVSTVKTFLFVFPSWTKTIIFPKPLWQLIKTWMANGRGNFRVDNKTVGSEKHITQKWCSFDSQSSTAASAQKFDSSFIELPCDCHTSYGSKDVLPFQCFLFSLFFSKRANAKSQCGTKPAWHMSAGIQSAQKSWHKGRGQCALCCLWSAGDCFLDIAYTQWVSEHSVWGTQRRCKSN